MTDFKNFLGFINESAKAGLLTSEDKLKCKELLSEDNGIIVEIAEEFLKDGDKETCISKIKEYLKIFDDDTETNNQYVGNMMSPEAERMIQIKKERCGKKEEVAFINPEECEEGLSPKIVFDKK